MLTAIPYQMIQGYNAAKTALKPWQTIELTPEKIRFEKETGETSCVVQGIGKGLKKSDLRPLAPMIGFNGPRLVEKDAAGHFNFSPVAVAGVTVDTQTVEPGDLVFAVQGHDYLRTFEIVTTEDEDQVRTLRYRIAAAYQVLSKVDADKEIGLKLPLVIVQRLESPIWIGQAFKDIDEDSEGVVRVHSISGSQTVEEYPDIAGDEEEFVDRVGPLLIRVYNRFGAINAEDWTYFGIVDGVFSTIGGSCGCPIVWVFSSHGAITGGTWEFPLTINEVEEIIVCDWNGEASSIENAIEGHSQYGEPGVPEITEVAYGPINQREVHIKWSEDVPVPLVDSTGLTGDDGCAVRSGAFVPGV